MRHPTRSCPPARSAHGLAGIEGQAYWSFLTLYGQAGYNSTIDSLSSGPGTIDNVHAWFARATDRAYINPSLRLEGTVQYANGSHDFTARAPGVDFNEWLWRGPVRMCSTKGHSDFFHLTGTPAIDLSC